VIGPVFSVSSNYFDPFVSDRHDFENRLSLAALLLAEKKAWSLGLLDPARISSRALQEFSRINVARRLLQVCSLP
jgi:hypothetical protein